MPDLIMSEYRLKQIITEEVAAVTLLEAGIPLQRDEYQLHDLYGILSSGGLSITPDSDKQTIKKAFRNSLMKGEYRHPDLGGNSQMNALLTRAYATLSADKSKYDKAKFGPLQQLKRRITNIILKKYVDFFTSANQKNVNEAIQKNLRKELIDHMTGLGYQLDDVERSLDEMGLDIDKDFKNYIIKLDKEGRT